MDTEKINKARNGDAQSFYELISERKELLYKTAYLYVKNEQDALDIVGETVFHAFRSIGKLRHSEFFSTWLVKILINQALLTLKRNKRTCPLVQEQDIPRFEAGLCVEERLDLFEAVDQLQEPYKSIVILKYMHDLSNTQISEILESPVGTVKVRLHRAIKQLRYYVTEGEINHEC